MKVFGLDSNVIRHAFSSGRLRVAVFGLGKMGLPLAAVFAEKGAEVVGVDVDAARVKQVNNGESGIGEEPGLEELVRAQVGRGRLRATRDGVQAARYCDVMVVIVPTLLDGGNAPDLTAVESVCDSIAGGLAKGDLVVLESTTPPGTTKDVVRPILERSGLTAGKDFGLACCPERTSSGRAIRDITGSYPKIVGGIDAASTETAAAFYSVVTDNEVMKTDCTTAEMAKLLQGLYRDVNIALANELAMYCADKGIDFSAAREIGNTDPNCNIHRPGAGVGGHCIPVYPHFVMKTSKEETRLLQLARRINDSMPHHVVALIAHGLGQVGRSVADSNILLLGLAYRGGVKETRYSPTPPVIQRLAELGANLYLYDPLFSREEVEALGVKYGETFDDMDCAVVMSDHQEFAAFDWQDIAGRMRCRLVVDGRQVVEPATVRQLGFTYQGIGSS